jgi:hypothetical protein
MAVGRLRLLPASEAATQPIPQYMTLNYGDLFKIQHVSNPFPLRPVSFSTLASYLECPGCALEMQRKRRAKEPKYFTNVFQGSLFGTGAPDPRQVGTLLHAIINLLHDPQGPVRPEQRALLLRYPDVLTRFIRYDLLSALQEAGKIKLAIFLDEMHGYDGTLRKAVIEPLLRYQHELARTRTTVFAGSERFQFKLLSTKNTFANHLDWGGYVGLVGEFDQIRLRRSSEGMRSAIMEFKKGLGKKRSWDKLYAPQRDEYELAPSDDLTEPGLAHALQLMIYWMAFQTRWDVMGPMLASRGRVEDLRMPLQQELDLILYDLNDGSQYQLVPTDLQQTLVALTNCIFHLNWAMKSGYICQSPEHDCGKTQLLAEMPGAPVPVGYSTLPADQCYRLARKAFQEFSTTIRWQKLPRA